MESLVDLNPWLTWYSQHIRGLTRNHLASMHGQSEEYVNALRERRASFFEILLSLPFLILFALSPTPKNKQMATIGTTALRPRNHCKTQFLVELQPKTSSSTIFFQKPLNQTQSKNFQRNPTLKFSYKHKSPFLKP